jgi:hypothetical protein
MCASIITCHRAFNALQFYLPLRLTLEVLFVTRRLETLSRWFPGQQFILHRTEQSITGRLNTLVTCMHFIQVFHASGLKITSAFSLFTYCNTICKDIEKHMLNKLETVVMDFSLWNIRKRAYRLKC